MGILHFLASYRFSRYIKSLALLWDLTLLNTTFLVSLFIRHGNLYRLDEVETKSLVLLSNLFWLFIVFYKDAYTMVRVERIEQAVLRNFKYIMFHMMLMVLLIIFLNYDHLSRLHLLYFYALFGVSAVLSRIGLIKSLQYARANGYNYRRVIIVGSGKTAASIEEVLQSDLSYGFRIIGRFQENQDGMEQSTYNLNELGHFLVTNQVHEMYVALSTDQPDIMRQMVFLAEKYMVRIKFIPNFYSFTKGRKVSIDFYGNIPIMMLRKEPLESISSRITKKLFDVGFSLFVIIFIFSWLFPILMLLVKVSSSGPIFFKQKRTGEDQAEFTCLKFRTMRENQDSDRVQATSSDPRITRIGKFMRKTNLDELPQFFNVLKGTMSVVGPRPHMLKHTEQYGKLIDNYLVRHFAKPGITGWAQVNGYRGETKELRDMEKRVEYDIWYIENWSFVLDIKIIWLTIWNMVKGEENAV